MLLNLSDISEEPFHSQISRQVRAKVLSGELTANQSLPSIRTLARDTRVSVITVQRAYEDLEREGIIYSRPGKGFFVSDLSEDLKYRLAIERLRSLIERPLSEAERAGLTREQILESVQLILNKREAE